MVVVGRLCEYQVCRRGGRFDFVGGYLGFQISGHRGLHCLIQSLNEVVIDVYDL